MTENLPSNLYFPVQQATGLQNWMAFEGASSYSRRRYAAAIAPFLQRLAEMLTLARNNTDVILHVGPATVTWVMPGGFTLAMPGRQPVSRLPMEEVLSYMAPVARHAFGTSTAFDMSIQEFQRECVKYDFPSFDLAPEYDFLALTQQTGKPAFLRRMQLLIPVMLRKDLYVHAMSGTIAEQNGGTFNLESNRGVFEHKITVGIDITTVKYNPTQLMQAVTSWVATVPAVAVIHVRDPEYYDRLYQFLPPSYDNVLSGEP